MEIVTTKYVRKPIYVEAVRVTEENFLDVARWCHGTVLKNGTDEHPGDTETPNPADHYIHIRVNNPKSRKQTQASVGDWVLYAERGYKIYTNNAFHQNFDLVNEKDPAAQPEEPNLVSEVSDVEIEPASGF